VRKVYVLTAGVYSDYHILAIFTSRKRAEEYKKKAEKVWPYYQEEIRVEEYPLNIPPRRWVKTCVKISRDGHVIETWKRITKGEVEEIEGDLPFYDAYGNLVWIVHTEDEERAIKVANEIRAIILANDEWGDEEALERRFLGR